MSVWLALVVATAGLVLCSGSGRAQQDIDRQSYYRAVEYCRGDVPRPMALSPDRQILCFDGTASKDMDVSLAQRLNEGGLFVVRSSAGNAAPAMLLSDLIRQRHATVVVHDYCLSVCAAFFLIASHQAFVVKHTLVAWHYLGSDETNHPFCISLRMPPAGGPTRWRSVPCRAESSEVRADRAAQRRFFTERAVSPFFEAPPDSLYVRRMIKSRFAETGVYRDTAWTIHPRHYPTLFKTRIIVDAYPQSQQEVDHIVSQLHLGTKVIYDP